MARPLRILFPGAFYHVMCRGNERKKIFLDDADRTKFLMYLKESIEIYRVNLHAYVLMHNHFHLVVETLHANLNEFMRRFNICYTGWFNYHHRTCGHLYQGRYRAILVDVDSYLLELSRYVHLNPVRTMPPAAIKKQWQYLVNYKWSSFAGYVDQRRRLDFVYYDLINAMIGGSRYYKRFISGGLEKGTTDIFKKVRYQMILGRDEFISHLQQKHLGEGSMREQPAYRAMSEKFIDPRIVITSVHDVFGVAVDRTKSLHGFSVMRGIAAEFLYRYCGIDLTHIGRLLGGINYTGVGMLRHRLKKRMEQDPSIEEKLQKVEKKIQSKQNVKCEDLTPSG